MAEPLKHLKQWVTEIEKQLFEEFKMLDVPNGNANLDKVVFTADAKASKVLMLGILANGTFHL